MSSNQEQNEKGIGSYEDKKILVYLLSEYSEKLLNVCDKIDKERTKISIFVSFLSVFFFTLLTMFFLLILPFSSLIENKNQLGLATLVLLGFTLAIVYSFMSPIYGAIKKKNLLIKDAINLSIKLKKVIRIASQAQEHIVTGFIGHIELDLRLADAESALQHCYNTTGDDGKIVASIRY